MMLGKREGLLPVLCIITTEAIATTAKTEGIMVVFGAQRRTKKKNAADTTIRSVVDAILFIEKPPIFFIRFI
jgi:hypothetical protein